MATGSSQAASGGGLFRRTVRDDQGRLGLALCLLLFAMAVAAPRLTPFEATEQYPDGLTAVGLPRPPGTVLTLPARAADERRPARPERTARSLLGTDHLGRDLFCRLLYGARISLLVGLLAMLTAVFIGAAIGLLAGFLRGWVELLLMRLTDIMLTIPTLVLAIALAVVLPKDPVELFGREYPRQLLNLFVVIGLVNWTSIARIVRSETLRVSALEFIEAARALGCSNARILVRHVLPNVLPTIVVLGSLATANTILLDAGLSYLGIGTPPPLPSWGAMINDGQPYLVTAPWLILGPGIAVVIAVLGFNLLGQGLQNALNPYENTP